MEAVFAIISPRNLRKQCRFLGFSDVVRCSVAPISVRLSFIWCTFQNPRVLTIFRHFVPSLWVLRSFLRDILGPRIDKKCSFLREYSGASSNRGHLRCGGVKGAPYSKLPELLKLRISDEKFPAPLCLIVCFRVPLCPLSFERYRM